MSGIAGQIALTPGAMVEVAEVTRLLRAQIHRGPDDDGMFVDPGGRVALGMRRLAIIDLASGGQPVHDEDRSLVCVFDGAIYNFSELREDLERRGYAFRSKSDAEVIANLYRAEGLGFLARLRGMFAIALWDSRRETLIVARDPVGKKPLYYAEAAGRLTFASEIAPLYDVRALSRELDPTALDHYMTSAYIPAPFTPFKAIRKLAPGELVSIRRGRIETVRYWRPAPRDVAGLTRPEVAGLVRRSIEDSVRLRMVSDAPIGCFLSGGLDSSIVAATMARLSSEPVRTFSVGFGEPPYDELRYARLVARHVGAEHEEFVVRPDAVAALPEIVRHCGEPFGDSSAVAVWHVAQLARKHVSVVLTGDGGDEVFAGYAWYRSALRLNRLSQARALLAPLRLLGRGAPTRLRRLQRRVRMSPARRFASLRACADASLTPSLYAAPFAAGIRADAADWLTTHYDSYHGDQLAKMQYTDVATSLPEDLLVKVDRMTMAHSLEGRCPLLDTSLVELGLGISAALKLDAAGGKAILRAAARRDLPAEILARPSMGFSLPVAAWLRGELRDRCRRKVLGPALLDRGWFERRAVEPLVGEHLSGRRDHSAELWRLLVLAEWAERYAP
jgi:asparagine synthase (glutamine-hydrolysing)